MPERHTIVDWASSTEADSIPDLVAFAASYARARQLAADAMDDDIDRVSRDGGRDIIVEYVDGIRVERVDHENIQRSKLIVDALKWRASKRYPDRYGDRIAHQALDEHGKPAKMEITVSMREPTDTSG